jgi:hypothetical protein
MGEGMASVDLLIVVLVGSAVGAFTGMAIGGLIPDLYLAMIAGVLATIVAGIVRNAIMTRVGAEPGSSGTPALMMVYSAVAIDRRIPLRVLMCSAVASLAGSAAAVQIASVGEVTSAVLIGTLAGLFAGILMAMLIMVYDMKPQPSDELPPNQ